MANYTEILNEIQEQIDEIIANRDAASASIEEKNQEIAELQQSIQSFTSQLEGLEQLKANAQSLIDQLSSHDINLNINVSTSGGSSSTYFNGSTPV